MISRAMALSEAFPSDILHEIRCYPGNDRCCDCKSFDTDWCSISHGTLICLECAGKHRSLGVLVSFVRSISMDSWSRQQVEMMRQGGNEQIKKFFRKLEIENSPISTLYCSKGASHYRERLKEKVDKIMAGELKSEPRHVHSRRNMGNAHHKNARSQPALGDLMRNDPTLGLNRRKPSIELFNVSFPEGPMGMTISKDFGGRALVSKVVPGGVAEASGVFIGDHIAGIARKRMDNYDEIMHMIPCMKRPILIQFSRQVSNHAKRLLAAGNAGDVGVAGDNDMMDASSPGRNRSLHGSKSMATLSLNLATVRAASSNADACSAPNSGYSKPRIRSPRYELTGINESDGEDEESPRSLRSPSGLTRLKSFRSKSKESPDGSTGKIGFGSVDGAEAQDSNSETSPSIPIPIIDSSNHERFTPSSSLSLPTTGQSGLPSSSTPTPSPINDDGMSTGIVTGTSGTIITGSVSASVSGGINSSSNNNSNAGSLDVDLYREIDQLLLSAVGVASGEADCINAPEESSPEGKHLDQRKHVLVANDNLSRRLTLQAGTPLKVLRNDRWRSASMRRMHRDGSFKVVFRDGSSEAHVGIDRIAMTIDTVKALTDWHTCTTATDQSEEHLAAAFQAASMEEMPDSEHDIHSSPDSSSYALLGGPNVHSFTTEDLRSSSSFLRSTDSFVVEDAVDLNSWIESDAFEENFGERARLSSLDSNISDGIGSLDYINYSIEKYDYVEAVYDQAPLGLRISSSPTPMTKPGQSHQTQAHVQQVRPPEVTKVVPEGRSSVQGIRVGDELVLIEGRQVRDYHDAMVVLQSSTYPLRLHFRRVNTSLQKSVTKTSMVLMNNLLDSMGLQKNTPPLAQSPPQMKRLASNRFAGVSIPASVLHASSNENSPHRPVRSSSGSATDRAAHRNGNCSDGAAAIEIASGVSNNEDEGAGIGSNIEGTTVTTDITGTTVSAAGSVASASCPTLPTTRQANDNDNDESKKKEIGAASITKDYLSVEFANNKNGDEGEIQRKIEPSDLEEISLT